MSNLELLSLETQKMLNKFFGESLKTDGILCSNTFSALDRATEKLKTVCKNKGYLFPDGFYDIRSGTTFTNKAEDCFAFVRNGRVRWVLPQSTMPGHFWIYNPLTVGGVTGTAVLVEGQYLRTWRVSRNSRFGFSSVELLQVRPVTIWRDGNKNNVLDATVKQTGLFGINRHTKGWATLIGRWSAGCLVAQAGIWKAFAALEMTMGEEWSGTLLNLKDLR